MRISARTVPGRCPGRLSGIGPGGPAASPSLLAYFPCCGIQPGYRWYGPGVPKSPILPLAAAVTAVALGASPAQAAPLSPGKRDEAKVVAFPLLAVKGQAPASVGSHVSHSSHSTCRARRRARLPCLPRLARLVGPCPGADDRGAGACRVPAALPPARARPPARAPAASATSGGSPAVAPPQAASRAARRSWGAAARPRAWRRGCAFVLVAPFGALAGRIRRLARRWRAR